MSERDTKLVVLLEHPIADDAELIGGCERAAVASGVALRDALGGTLTAVTMGPHARAAPLLAAALAAGCDRAVCVAGDSDHEALLVLSPARAAELLATALRRIGCDLLLCGDHSGDAPLGAVGPVVAEVLGIPHMTGIATVRAGDHDRTVIAEHRSNGSLHRFRCALPVVLCVLGAPGACDGPAHHVAGEAADDHLGALVDSAAELVACLCSDELVR